MKIAFVHYNIGETDGVNTVIRTNALSILKNYKNSKIYFVGNIVKPLISNHNGRVRHINIPELDIMSKTQKDSIQKSDVFDYMKQGMTIFLKLDNALKDVDYIIIENPNIGIHPGATYGFYRFVRHNYRLRSKRKIIYRIHDFAEDRRGNFVNLLKFRGSESYPYWHKVLFPKVPNIGYFVINKKDMLRLQSHGLVEDNIAFYVPNPINEKLFCSDFNVSLKLREQIIKKYSLQNDVKFIFYPVRIVERKNVEEAILLTQLLRKKFNENYVLVVSLRPSSGDSYYEELNDFVKVNKLPIILGLNELVTIERSHYKKSGKIKTYGIGDMYNISDKIITTSFLEGFGMFFIESWFYNKSIIGRDLPYVTMDFKDSGINLEHMYSSLFIDKIEFRKYSTLKEKLEFSLKITDETFYTKFNEENKQALSGLYSMFNSEIESKIIAENNSIVKSKYSAKSIAKILVNSLKKTQCSLDFIDG